MSAGVLESLTHMSAQWQAQLLQTQASAATCCKRRECAPTARAAGRSTAGTTPIHSLYQAQVPRAAGRSLRSPAQTAGHQPSQQVPIGQQATSGPLLVSWGKTIFQLSFACIAFSVTPGAPVLVPDVACSSEDAFENQCHGRDADRLRSPSCAACHSSSAAKKGRSLIAWAALAATSKALALISGAHKTSMRTPGDAALVLQPVLLWCPPFCGTNG